MKFNDEQIKLYNLTSEKISKLNLFDDHVLKENENFNLTAITDENDFFIKNILDSLSILEYFELRGNILDIGTGAGIPGIILAIVKDDCNYCLIDSNNKKIIFLNALIKKLNLSNVEAIWTRAENFKSRKFDFILSRAVAKITPFVINSFNLLELKGNYIFYKGPNYHEELKTFLSFKQYKHKLKLSNKFEFKLNNEYSRTLISLIKTNS